MRTPSRPIFAGWVWYGYHHFDDYVRATTTVGARHATAAEAADLGLSAGSVVLVTRSLDILPDGTPLQIGITRFVADRVELDIGRDDRRLTR